MPLVRISLPKKFAKETKNAVSIAIHESLMNEFHIPKDDYFHIIEELETEQIKHPESYLSIPHSDNIVYIQITAGAG